MDILLNELSLSGQYGSREAFVENDLPIVISMMQEVLSTTENINICKSQNLYSRKVTAGDSLHDMLAGSLSRQYPSIRRLKRYLTHFFHEPYWENGQRHSTSISYIYKGENVTGTSLAEACERDQVVLSFPHNNYKVAVLTICADNGRTIELDNICQLGQWCGVAIQRGLVVLFSLKNNPAFQKQHWVVQGQPVYREVSTGYLWYLDNFHKNHYEVFDETGQNHLGEADMKGMLDITKCDRRKHL